MNDEIRFSRSAARHFLPRVADPLLQWSMDWQTRERHIYSGWLCKADKLEALDATEE